MAGWSILEDGGHLTGVDLGGLDFYLDSRAREFEDD